MMRFLVVLALAGCSAESTEDRLEQFKAQADITCWTYFGCDDNDGYGPAKSPPSTPIEQGADCMNDALASGARAVASWGVDNFNLFTETRQFVFTVDHQVKVFTSHRDGVDPPEFYESPSCDGPFRVDEQAVCSASGPGGRAVDVKVLAWDGCPSAAP